ncbi:MAG: hypothetical protein ACJ763_19175 [Bdellovibrionia bacterium]
MQKRKRRLFAGAASAAVMSWLAVAFFAVQAQSPTPPPAPDIASVSEEVNQHTHSITLSDSEVDGLIAITGNNDSVTLQSSQAYNGDPKNGSLHSHQLRMDKQQLQVLKSTGSIDVECDEAAGHKHIFRFYKPQPQQCTIITYPIPGTYAPNSCPYGGKCTYPMPYPMTCTTCPKPCTTCQYPYPYPTVCPTCPPPKPCPTCGPLPPPGYTPTPTPTSSPGGTGTPSPSPSLSPSPNPSPSPSASPSPSPSPSASPSPGGSPSPGASGGASPTPSLSASPSPTTSAGATASPTSTATATSTPTSSPSSSSSPGAASPSPSPVSTCSIPGTDCYCANPLNFNSSACTTICQTAGSPCYCASNPLDPSCFSGRESR